MSLAALGAGDTALALTRAELYQAKVPVADRSEASKPAAFENALRVVLVRVTGRRSAGDEAVFAPLLGNARRYVQQYRDTQDGQLWVSFDGAAIDRWLEQANQPLWGRERPSTFVWLTVPGGAQQGTVITAEDTSDLKQSIDAAAYERGAPVIWPSIADLQRNRLDYASVASASIQTLEDIGHRSGSDATLVGRANAPGMAAQVRWTFVFKDRSSEFSGPAPEGINRAADSYAGLLAVNGAAAAVVIEVVGVNDLKDYAFVQSYLESLAFISHVGVDSLNGNVVQFRLTSRGGADAVRNALPPNGRLQPGTAGEGGLPRFELRH